MQEKRKKKKEGGRVVVGMLKTSKDRLGRGKKKRRVRERKGKKNLLCKPSWEERDSRSILRGKTKVTAPFIP